MLMHFNIRNDNNKEHDTVAVFADAIKATVPYEFQMPTERISSEPFSIEYSCCTIIQLAQGTLQGKNMRPTENI